MLSSCLFKILILLKTKEREFMKNMIIKSTSLLVGALLFTSSLFAKDDVQILTVHHFMSSKAPLQTKFLEPWAKKVEEASGGKLKIEIFPSMSMGGKPNELYKQVRDGSADIVWTLPGYTPGVFPRTEVFELPTVHIGDAVATSIAIREKFDLIKDDFTDVQPLLVYVAAGNAIHTVNKRISNISDLKGLKLRAPSRTAGWYIEAMGAESVGMPLPDLPQALSKNAIDGGLIPFEVFPSYKFAQLTQYSLEGEKGERFGTSVFMLLMNKDRFASLSKELQKVLMDSVDMNTVKEVGQLWMDVEKPGMEMQKASQGGEIVKLDSKAMAEFNKVGEEVVKKWVEEANTKGINGQKLVDSAREAISKNSK
jgi:TRAP-type C4-dicarboxylate transport system substrate-binding protein